MIEWLRRLLERWGWSPPEAETQEKERHAEELHQAAIDARVSFEAGVKTTRPLIRRVEKLAAAYVAEEHAAAAAARAATPRRKGRTPR